jgi:hypothetical protein
MMILDHNAGAEAGCSLQLLLRATPVCEFQNQICQVGRRGWIAWRRRGGQFWIARCMWTRFKTQDHHFHQRKHHCPCLSDWHNDCLLVRFRGAAPGLHCCTLGHRARCQPMTAETVLKCLSHDVLSNAVASVS